MPSAALGARVAKALKPPPAPGPRPVRRGKWVQTHDDQRVFIRSSIPLHSNCIRVPHSGSRSLAAPIRCSGVGSVGLFSATVHQLYCQRGIPAEKQSTREEHLKIWCMSIFLISSKNLESTDLQKKCLNMMYVELCMMVC